MPALELIRGPALREVRPDDSDALRHLGQEQRARLETIREERIWDWLGSIFADQMGVWPLFGLFAFLALVPITCIVAGFTQGTVLTIFLLLCVLAPLPYWLLYWPIQRRTLAFYERGEMRPAVVLAAEPELGDPDDEIVRSLQVLVGPELSTPESLQALVDAADRVLAAMQGGGDAALADFADQVRRAHDAKRGNGSRALAPVSLGDDYELASVCTSPEFLPNGELSDRLVFVLFDPRRRGRASARIVQSEVWGDGVDTLCAAFPREASA